MHLLKTSINGNPNVGLYGYVTDDFALVGIEVPEDLVKEYEKVLKVPVHRITVAGTSLIGVFVAGNSKGILVPNIIFDDERAQLDKLGIKYTLIDTKLTALGNNILCNDQGALINPEFTDEQLQAIQDALGVPTQRATIANLEIVGACAAINANGGIVHREIEDTEKELVEDALQIEVEASTINLGSPYIRSGILTNSKGFIIGELSAGPEVTFADECLGFLTTK
ncbi:translation initiation factor IF-6 [Candidatus Woesearchaeota archaeon]|nr:MAG: translation initiation factor IF-6 [Candidatus Woesearchaeota archaeon]